MELGRDSEYLDDFSSFLHFLVIIMANGSAILGCMLAIFIQILKLRMGKEKVSFCLQVI